MTEKEINATIRPLLVELKLLEKARKHAYTVACRVAKKMPKAHTWRVTDTACTLEELEETIVDMVGTIEP